MSWRALGRGSQLLLCDEPLPYLDVHLRARNRVDISTLGRAGGAAVTYLTHDQQEAWNSSATMGDPNPWRRPGVKRSRP